MMGGPLSPASLRVLLVKLFIRQNGIAAMQKLHRLGTSIQKQSIAEICGARKFIYLERYQKWLENRMKQKN